MIRKAVFVIIISYFSGVMAYSQGGLIYQSGVGEIGIRIDSALFAKKSWVLGQQLWQQDTSGIFYTAGNVGIGVNSSSYKLRVSGSTRLDGLLLSSVSSENIADFQSTHTFPTLKISSTGTQSNRHPMISFRDHSSQVGCVGVDIDQGILSLGISSINDDFLTVSSNGMVGIGTSNALRSLHLQGGSTSQDNSIRLGVSASRYWDITMLRYVNSSMFYDLSFKRYGEVDPYFSITGKDGLIQMGNYNFLNTQDTTGLSGNALVYDEEDGRIKLSTVKAEKVSYDNTDSEISSTNVQDAVDELISTYEFPSHGSILYVATGGNNLTAIKGRLDKPYSTIQEAINNAISGDLILVLKGNYNLSGVNLWNPGIHIHLNNGVVLTSANFLVNTSGTMNVTGQGVMSTYFFHEMVTLGNVSNAILNIEADKVGYVYVKTGTHDCVVNVKVANSPTQFWLNGYTNSSETKIQGNKFTADIGNFGNNFQTVVELYSDSLILDNDVYVNIDKMHCSLGGVNNFTRGLFDLSSGGTGGVSNMNVSITIGQALFSGSLTFQLYGFNSLKNHTNLNYNLHCAQCVFDGSGKTLIGYNRSRFKGTNGVVTGSYLFRNKAIMYDARGTAYDSQSNVTLDGYFESRDTSLIVARASSIPAGLPLKLKGEFKTANHPIIDATQDIAGLTLWGAKLINDQTVAAVRSSVANTINVMNSYTNSTIVDVDVTENIETLTKDADVK